MTTPADKCGFIFDDQSPNDSSHCCYRDTWGDRDQCIWHALVTEGQRKPIKTLRHTLTNRAVRDQVRSSNRKELLDGAKLRQQELGSQIDFEGLSFRQADLSRQIWKKQTSKMRI